MTFEYDVFLSYSHKDENIVHPLANRLKQDGLRVWLDEWAIEPGDSIPIKIQQGLEKSHIFLMCMSPAYFDSKWAIMEHNTVIFRDPINTQNRLIPLLIADCTLPDFIAHFKYIDLRKPSNEAYRKILTSCKKRNSQFSSTNLTLGVQSNIPDTFISPSTGMKFVLIPTGKFMLRSVHDIKIEEPFYLGRYEVTQKQWRKVIDSNPSEFMGDDLPVERVSWEDAQEFIKKLNKMESTDKYCLPSEAKWAYACSVGATTTYFFGDNESELDYYAWYDNNSGDEIHPVGQKKPNRWGLYDMCGNVWEWCQDKYHDNISNDPYDGRAWESGSGSRRVLLGGCWNGEASFCQSNLVGFNVPTLRGNNVGFRVMRIL